MGGNGTGMSGNLNLYSGEEDNEETEAIENILSAGSNVSIATTDSGTKIVYTVKNPDEILKYDSRSKVYQIPITFNALLGSDFGSTKEFANYMIKLEVEMYSDATATSNIDGSRDNDHVIYTHAKILPTVVE